MQTKQVSAPVTKTVPSEAQALAQTDHFWRVFRKECVVIWQEAQWQRDQAQQKLSLDYKKSATRAAVIAGRSLQHVSDLVSADPDDLTALADFFWLHLEMARAEQAMCDGQRFYDYAMGNEHALDFLDEATWREFACRWEDVFARLPRERRAWEKSGLALDELFWDAETEVRQAA
jgi:hypothetical protein